MRKKRHRHRQHTNPLLAALSSGAVTRIGALILTAMALVAATEKLQHIDLAIKPVVTAKHAAAGTGKDGDDEDEEEDKKSEGLRKTVRAHEDYDVGLRMPAISGS